MILNSIWESTMKEQNIEYEYFFFFHFHIKITKSKVRDEWQNIGYMSVCNILDLQILFYSSLIFFTVQLTNLNLAI